MNQFERGPLPADADDNLARTLPELLEARDRLRAQLGVGYLPRLDAVRSMLRQLAAVQHTTVLRVALNTCARNDVDGMQRDLLLAAALESSER